MTMPKIHVKKGDTVLVITGKSAGKKGKVLEVLPKEGRVLIEGVNVVKRHTKPTQQLPQGGIIDKEMPVASSNVLLWCGNCNNAVRTGKQIQDNDKKVRICKKCGEILD
jgi:large subunit ribosomal protein L24